VLWVNAETRHPQNQLAMKTNLFFHQPLALVCLAVALGALPTSLNAQEKARPLPPKPTGASPAPASPGTSEPEAFRRRYGIPREGAAPGASAAPYALEIMDGKLSLANLKGNVNLSKRWGAGKTDSVPASLANIIDVLRDLHPEANVVMSPELANIQIADLKLRATSLDEELEALRVASGNRFVWTKPGVVPMGAVDPATGLPVAAVGAGESTLYSLVPDESGGMTTKRDMEVFNLGSYLANEEDPKTSIEQIEKIILNTLSQLRHKNLAPDEDPDFQFHAGANLLIVIGRQDALEVARKVVSALQTQTGGGGGFGGGVGFGGPMPYVPNVPFRTSKERQIILNKLENIRLDSILYDGLPLSEVVKNLIDEARKRDPEKKGVNFLMDPNPPATATRTTGVDPATGLPMAAAPTEAMDINSISIKINPPLTNVRLLDVLEAVVRVADLPIKYSVTDYAVVFSLARNEAPTDNPWVPGNPPPIRPTR
jgi:hypothetical protein